MTDDLKNKRNKEDVEREQETRGQRYTGGDYDPSQVSTRTRDYYARSYEFERIPSAGRGFPTYGEDEDSDWRRAPGYYFPEDGEREAWERPGPYTGRGPQGYRRSKESIHEEICEHMTRHGWLDASEITITVDDQNEVTLEGTVESRRAKRLAEDLAEDVRGVQDVHNRLRVQRQDPS